MGFLSFKADNTKLRKLPTGSFTVDSNGTIVTSTVPTSFPVEEIRRTGQHVLQAFRRGHQAGYPFAELIIHYAAFKLSARELRGGAIVFFSPRNQAAI